MSNARPRLATLLLSLIAFASPARAGDAAMACPAGVYFVRARSGGASESRKIVLLR